MPGVSETLDWVGALAALDRQEVDLTAVEYTIGVVLKSRDDQEAVPSERLAAMLRKVLNG